MLRKNIIFILFAATSLIAAEDDVAYQNKSADPLFIQKEQKKSTDQLKAKTKKAIEEDDSLELSSPSRIYTKEGADVYATIDFLCFKAKENGLYYAHAVAGPGSQNLDPSEYDINGGLQKVVPDWDPAFRLGLGFNLPYDDWDFFAQWTHLKTDAKHSTNDELVMLWAHSNIHHFHYKSRWAKAKWKLKLNMFDMDLGRGFYIGERFSLRPSFGIATVFIKQAFKINNLYYASDHLHNDIDLYAVNYPKSDYTGAGIKAALDARFYFIRQLSILAAADGSMYYGKFNADFYEKENETKVAYTRDRFNMGINHFHLALGLVFDIFYGKNDNHLGFQMTWEQSMFFGVNQMNHYRFRFIEGIFSQHNDDLSLQAIAVKLRWDF